MRLSDQDKLEKKLQGTGFRFQVPVFCRAVHFAIDNLCKKGIELKHIKEVIIMRATLNIPDSLIKDLLRVTGERKKTKAICIALDDYIRSRRKEKLLALSGKVQFDLDWQKMEDTELEGMKDRETRRKPR